MKKEEEDAALRAVEAQTLVQQSEPVIEEERFGGQSTKHHSSRYQRAPLLESAPILAVPPVAIPIRPGEG